MSWPDATELLIGQLTLVLAPVHVGSRVPHPRPARLVRVRRVGGVAEPPVREQARFDVLAWAPDEPEAMRLALRAREAIWALPGQMLDGVAVYRAEETLGPRADDDPETGTPRVWATYAVTLRAPVIHPAAP